MQERSKEVDKNDVELTPLCEKCGNAMIKEDGQWLCPHCQGEIDFLGEDDE